MKRISIQNIHPGLRVKKKTIQLLVQNVLASEKANSGVDVIFVDDRFMRKLNKQFTLKGGTTDVLSFEMSGSQLAGVECPSLGDVYVSLDQAKRQAAEYNVGFQDEVALLVVHGLLHLLGYDHKNKKEENIMRRKEQLHLRKVGKVFKSS
ncbi:MAG: rRNA maturation RNase YbeY [candidate division Zixibacteria bacterium]|nr:rRNA maturation RNase YbeY [candidate division Zixibacteria bacterium]